MTKPTPSRRGPRLVDHMLTLMDNSGLTQAQLRARYGFGITWIPDVRSGRNKNPGVDHVQMVIEDLSGEPLIKTW